MSEKIGGFWNVEMVRTCRIDSSFEMGSEHEIQFV